MPAWLTKILALLPDFLDKFNFGQSARELELKLELELEEAKAAAKHGFPTPKTLLKYSLVFMLIIVFCIFIAQILFPTQMGNSLLNGIENFIKIIAPEFMDKI